jgi:hypothetical protein
MAPDGIRHPSRCFSQRLYRAFRVTLRKGDTGPPPLFAKSKRSSPRTYTDWTAGDIRFRIRTRL